MSSLKGSLKCKSGPPIDLRVIIFILFLVGGTFATLSFYNQPWARNTQFRGLIKEIKGFSKNQEIQRENIEIARYIVLTPVYKIRSHAGSFMTFPSDILSSLHVQVVQICPEYLLIQA